MSKEMEIDAKDCETIIEALDSWINSDLVSVITAGMISTMIKNHGDPESRKTAEEVMKEGKQAFEESKRKKTEVARLLQAKIILLKDRIQVENLTNG